MLHELSAHTSGILLDMAYATPQNFIGKAIYKNALCFLHVDAHEKILKAASLAQKMGFFLKIFDAFRPTEAQWLLWEHCPNPTFVADPTKGSPHSRGIAVDLTLVDRQTHEDLDMGTPFDDFTDASFHGETNISINAQRNRRLLLGLMSEVGFDFYQKEWWHYQLFNVRDYPLLSDRDAPYSLMH